MLYEMTCEKVLKNLKNYYERELEEIEDWEMTTHLHECPECLKAFKKKYPGEYLHDEDSPEDLKRTEEMLAKEQEGKGLIEREILNEEEMPGEKPIDLVIIVKGRTMPISGELYRLKVYSAMIEPGYFGNRRFLTISAHCNEWRWKWKGRKPYLYVSYFHEKVCGVDFSIPMGMGAIDKNGVIRIRFDIVDDGPPRAIPFHSFVKLLKGNKYNFKLVFEDDIPFK